MPSLNSLPECATPSLVATLITVTETSPVDMDGAEELGTEIPDDWAGEDTAGGGCAHHPHLAQRKEMASSHGFKPNPFHPVMVPNT